LGLAIIVDCRDRDPHVGVGSRPLASKLTLGAAGIYSCTNSVNFVASHKAKGKGKYGSKDQQFLARGIPRHGRSAMLKKRIQKIKLGPKGKQIAAKAAPAKALPANLSGMYPGEDAPKPLRSRKVARPTALKAGYTPGTV